MTDWIEEFRSQLVYSIGTYKNPYDEEFFTGYLHALMDVLAELDEKRAKATKGDME